MTPEELAVKEFEAIDICSRSHPTHPHLKIIRETMDGNTQVFYCLFKAANRCLVYFTFRRFQWSSPSYEITNVEKAKTQQS